jgi:hypothetical protein
MLVKLAIVAAVVVMFAVVGVLLVMLGPTCMSVVELGGECGEGSWVCRMGSAMKTRETNCRTVYVDDAGVAEGTCSVCVTRV